MCLSPISIPNPYYNPNKNSKYILRDGNLSIPIDASLYKYYDTISSHISVPCGKCSQCVSLRQAFYLQRVQMESLRSELFFFTLTYNNRSLKFTDVLDYKIPYPFYRDIQDCFRRMRLQLPHAIRYFVSSEYGNERKRPHYHGFIAVSHDDINNYYLGNWRNAEKFFYKFLLSNWKRNYGSRKHPKYDNLLDLVIKRGRSTYDLHRVEPISNHENDVSFYVTKYAVKFDKRTDKLLAKITLDPRLSDEQTKLLRSQIKPRFVMSKDFGDFRLLSVQSHINKCIKSSHLDIPQYYDIYTGKPCLLNRYYRKHLYGEEFLHERYLYYQKLTNYENVNNFSPFILDDSFFVDSDHQSCKKTNQFTKIEKIRSKLRK